MIYIVHILLGAGLTGYTWYKSTTDKEPPTYWEQVFDILKVVALVISAILLIRWLYSKGTVPKTIRKHVYLKPENTSQE